MENNNNSLDYPVNICPQCGAQVDPDTNKGMRFCPHCGAPLSSEEAAPVQKKRHTLLWVFGWIFCFPIPLTILMQRNQKLDKHLRYGIIAAAWILYLLLGVLRYRSAAQQRKQLPPENSTSVTATAPVQTEVPALTQPPSGKSADQSPKQTVSETPAKIEEQQESQLPGVSPEFKTAMDSYETFFDEYVDFMQKFSENPSDLSLLMQYTEFMSQYTETMNDLNAIGESELTPEENAYYLEVMTRINSKLLEAAQYMTED